MVGIKSKKKKKRKREKERKQYEIILNFISVEIERISIPLKPMKLINACIKFRARVVKYQK